MKAKEVPHMTVFLYAGSTGQKFEYVAINQARLIVMLARGRITKGASWTIPWSSPVDVIKLRTLTWEKLDGEREVLELRPDCRVLNLSELRTVQKWLLENVEARQEIPPPPKDLGLPVPAKLSPEPRYKAGKMPQFRRRAPGVDPVCISLKSTIELFGRFGVEKSIAEAALHGLRRKQAK